MGAHLSPRMWRVERRACIVEVGGLSRRRWWLGFLELVEGVVVCMKCQVGIEWFA